MYARVWGHQAMLADRVRMTAYQQAIHEVVDKGNVVADIGTGSGILACFAVQAGASKVYAVEQGDVIEDAERLAQVNGLADRIVFVKGRSDSIELPEPADVITSEIIGHFGLEEGVLKFELDARKRFLKPGGRLAPAWLALYLVPVETEALWQEHVGFWSADYYGLDFSPVRSHAISQRYVVGCSGKVNPLTTPALLAHLDFYQIDSVPSVFRGESVLDQGGRLHGLPGYFRAGLSPGVVLSTAPGEPATHWRQTFFPLPEPVRVEVGDRVRYTLKAIPQGAAICWEWNTRVQRNGVGIATYSQSNLHLSKAELAVGRASFRPTLTPEGQVRRRALDLCDGRRSMAEIAELLQAEYPQKYKTVRDAMADVVGMVGSVVQIELEAPDV